MTFSKTDGKEEKPSSSLVNHPNSGELPGEPPIGRDSDKDVNPGRKLRDLEMSAKNGPPPRVPWQYRLKAPRGLSQVTIWDLAGMFSLVVNVILIGLLIYLFGQMKSFKTTVNNLVGELYGDFVMMDQGSIKTTVQVNTQIPLDFEVPVNQDAQVVLARDISIQNAHLAFDTGIFNINTEANVTIPAGTTLPIALSLLIPVQTSVPVNLEVPVNIPLNQTGLHEPLVGLEKSLRPLYCMVNRNAQFPEGNYICTDHQTPTSGKP